MKAFNIRYVRDIRLVTVKSNESQEKIDKILKIFTNDKDPVELLKH